MVYETFFYLSTATPTPRFTIGITDDVRSLSFLFDAYFDFETDGVWRCIFHRTERRRHGRGKQKLGQGYRKTDRQLRVGLFCLRFEELGFDDELASALWSAVNLLTLLHPAYELRGLELLSLRWPHRCVRLRNSWSNRTA